jgi:hypothetical protein
MSTEGDESTCKNQQGAGEYSRVTHLDDFAVLSVVIHDRHGGLHESTCARSACDGLD